MVKGTVIEVVKGGLIVDVGLRGFLPASLVELRRVRDLQQFVGKELECKIIELDKNRNNVVLSRRAYLEEAHFEQRKDFLANLAVGERRTGTVSSVVNFGAFVDLGGVDGLVHVSELSWRHVDHPSEVVQVGQEIEVEVLSVEPERDRVSLSLKNTQEDPWQAFARAHKTGDSVRGVITKLVPFGAFIKVADGIEGLAHISELSEQHIELPEQVVQLGQEVQVRVIDVELERRRISLSLKQAGNAPAPAAEEAPVAEAAPIEAAAGCTGRRDRGRGGTGRSHSSPSPSPKLPRHLLRLLWHLLRLLRLPLLFRLRWSLRPAVLPSRWTASFSTPASTTRTSPSSRSSRA